MDTSVLLAILAFAIQFVVNLLTLGHYAGKFEGKIAMNDDQIAEVHKFALKTYKEFTEHKTDHGSLKTQVAVNDAKLTESMNGMRSEMKELKETFKEFTKEFSVQMREWAHRQQYPTNEK